ncbi:DUF2550 domain-containing protein [Corynebacterium breve]|uniref:DUF2550 domain-containing protein n=1 Tax=Corynebacterium breve TaxID=3049799 RepID=A0ABY8VGK6_9CORY|nr:DUF2550 domain-containing protein [Corynebacterium breve]WIM68639.1 DUF2550 domain-containing protein [Corynebacterium breve]
MEIVAWLLTAIAVACVALAVWRFVTLRSRGATVLIRRLPASGEHGWRHGTVQYQGDMLGYFKLRSLSPTADLTLDRRYTEVESHRAPSDTELHFMPLGSRIVQFSSRDQEYEISADRRSIMALISWLESAPDVRQEKYDHKSMTQRIGRRTTEG